MIGLSSYKHCMYFVEYDRLVSEPEQTLSEVESFIGLPKHNYDLFGIKNTCAENKDEQWGIKDLHTIRSKLEKKSRDPVEILGKSLYNELLTYNLKP